MSLSNTLSVILAFLLGILCATYSNNYARTRLEKELHMKWIPQLDRMEITSTSKYMTLCVDGDCHGMEHYWDAR